MATIAIIGALEKEVAQIREELSGAHEAQEAGLTVVIGELNGLAVVHDRWHGNRKRRGGNAASHQQICPAGRCVFGHCGWPKP